AALLLLLAACDKAEHPGHVSMAGGLTSFMPTSGGKMRLLPEAASMPRLYIDESPITQEIYHKVMGVNPSKQKNPQAPVAGVQWVDAARFCNKCSEMDGLKPCYDPKTWACDFDADGYRLPTEAEWEFACRAGSKTRYFFGDNPVELAAHAWTKQN